MRNFGKHDAKNDENLSTVCIDAIIYDLDNTRIQSARLPVTVKNIGEDVIDICIWDDSGMFTFGCWEKDEYDYSLTDIYPEMLSNYGNFCPCGELDKIHVFNYYLDGDTHDEIYWKYENDHGITITLFACNEDAIYNEGVILGECKTVSVTNQHMGYQEDCDYLTLTNINYTLGQLYVGIKVRFSDGQEYWVKMDDESVEGGKHLIQADCYMMGLYNSSRIYTNTTTRQEKRKTYNTDHYDIYLCLDSGSGHISPGNIFVLGPSKTTVPYLNEDITFTDNFGNTYTIPSSVDMSYNTPYQVGWVSQGDPLWDEAQNHEYDLGLGRFDIWCCKPVSSAWWYCTTPFYTQYRISSETADEIIYERYEFTIDY